MRVDEYLSRIIIKIDIFLMWQSVKVSNVFNTLTLKQIFWKTKTFFKKLEYCFLIEAIKMDLQNELQNGPITKSGVLPVTT